jgi:acyl-CoA thioester hydrolase
MQSAPPLLSEFPVVVPVELHWGDQDALGHVNNTVYLRWSETARIEYLTRIGIWPPGALEKIGPILAHISCDFLCPLTHPDTAYVSARVTAIGNSSFKMAHRIVSARRGVVAAELDSTLVLLDYTTSKSVPLPTAVRRAIGELEGREFAPVSRP